MMKANQHPLNQAARKFLPKDQQGQEVQLSALSLMNWGLEDGGLKVRPISPTQPDQIEVEEILSRLHQMAPDKAMRRLLEPESAPEVGVLEQMKVPAEAAHYLLASLGTNVRVEAA